MTKPTHTHIHRQFEFKGAGPGALCWRAQTTIPFAFFTQVSIRFPEMGEHLATAVNNDLTYNLKSSNCYVIHNRLNIPSYVAEKEVQTKKCEMKENEIREYILTHKSEVMEILELTANDLKMNNLSPAYPVSPSGSTNSVKFKFDSDMISFSPTNAVTNYNINSSKNCKKSGSPKKILKKQTNIVCTDGPLDLEMPHRKDLFHRSYSLCETNGELSPSSKERTRKQKWLEMTTLQRFQAKFSSRSSTSVSDSESATYRSDIPEIILNIPDDDPSVGD